MTKLFSPLKIKGITLKNRIGVSPMCQYTSIDGFANQWHLVHLGSRAVGGASLIIAEATAVSPEGRISPKDLGIWKDEHIEKLSEITAFIKENGSVAGIQLAHSGRKGSTMAPTEGYGTVNIESGGWNPVAPSPLPYSENYPQPIALSVEGIKKVVDDFKMATKRALQSGFEIIEIHASHGYLLHQFLSPLSNQRKDNYGGSFENRIKLLLEVVNAVKSVLPEESPLFVRIPATDWVNGGWETNDAIRLTSILKKEGVDVVDVTTGGLSNEQKIPVGPGYQTPFASKIKKETGMLTATVGMITNAAQAEYILVNEDADIILLAREFLRNPYFPLTAASELGEDITWPAQYNRAKL
ncbi:NADH:flavin oxidoreductase/NADH oxidase [Aestuariibaculum sediminum]|uniref:NADH:flavin oxidoreductase/NADH oxidase n=1 Tax=Aestuariibaculum sediminum TaxID=2770637 RepID=A0A8J6Q4B4_9FLAO|nr:NADH:flavin oxidoreductase/NADH oxidase [Aestuariibaculum sediminum]MBD0833380.1 NADH:flavin oxidoreductase/NADH oxidase [Aestuariibaculum sediminum]